MLSMISLEMLVRNWPVKICLKHINKVNVIMDFKPLLINKLKDTFFLLKINKSSDVDDVSSKIIKKSLGVVCGPLIDLFQQSLEKSVFPDD